jgi:thiamine pyrophosphokinase
MTGLLVTGGEGPRRAALEPFLRDVELVVAADSGFETALALGLTVDLVVGDMDSIRDPRLLAGLPAGRVERYPTGKDETDTEIAFRRLRERGCDRVLIAGGGGGALDHFLGVLMLFERDLPPALWVTRDALVLLLTGSCAAEARPGETVSFFPLGTLARVSRSSGLRWPLDGLCLRRGGASLRNEATSGTLRLDVSEGRLLMVRDIRERGSGAGQA